MQTVAFKVVTLLQGAFSPDLTMNSQACTVVYQADLFRLNLFFISNLALTQSPLVKQMVSFVIIKGQLRNLSSLLAVRATIPCERQRTKTHKAHVSS